MLFDYRYKQQPHASAMSLHVHHVGRKEMAYGTYTPGQGGTWSAALVSYKVYEHYKRGLIQDYQLLVLQEGEIRYIPVLFSMYMYTLEILGRGNQPHGWEIPMLPTKCLIIMSSGTWQQSGTHIL